MTTVFVQSKLEVILQQPEGFQAAGKENEVYSLRKSHFVLESSWRLWNQRFNVLPSSTPCNPNQTHACTSCRLVIRSQWWPSESTMVISEIKYLETNFEIRAVPTDPFVGLLIKRNRREQLLHISLLYKQNVAPKLTHDSRNIFSHTWQRIMTVHWETAKWHTWDFSLQNLLQRRKKRQDSTGITWCRLYFVRPQKS